VPIHPIVISILFHHYKELKECISEVEQIQEASTVRNYSSKRKYWLTKKEEQQQQQEEKQEAPATTLERERESYFVKNNAYISNNKYYSFSLFF
jgi:hypothetical protein